MSKHVRGAGVNSMSPFTTVNTWAGQISGTATPQRRPCSCSQHCSVDKSCHATHPL